MIQVNFLSKGMLLLLVSYDSS